MTDDEHTALPSGRILRKRYQIQKRLGGGGFGITYLAVLHGGEQVVVKEHFPAWCATRDPYSGQVLTNADGQESYSWSIRSFVREAEQLSILNHPNIISVIDTFEENGTAYYVMPYIRDGSLSDGVTWLHRHGRRLSQAAILKLLRALLDALRHMHHSSLRGKRVYHLDIKPGNILLSRQGVEAAPVLIDFGGPGMGSPGFMPHEQRQEQDIGPWTDLYALAATLYKLLTGAAPPSHVDKDRNALPEPPPRKRLADDPELRRSYDAGLLESLDKALSWEISERFADAGEWKEALDDIPLRWHDDGLSLFQLMECLRQEKPQPRLRRRHPSPIVTFLLSMTLCGFLGIMLLLAFMDDEPEEEFPPLTLVENNLKNAEMEQSRLIGQTRKDNEEDRQQQTRAQTQNASATTGEQQPDGQKPNADKTAGNQQPDGQKPNADKTAENQQSDEQKPNADETAGDQQSDEQKQPADETDRKQQPNEQKQPAGETDRKQQPDAQKPNAGETDRKRQPIEQKADEMTKQQRPAEPEPKTDQAPQPKQKDDAQPKPKLPNKQKREDAKTAKPKRADEPKRKADETTKPKRQDEQKRKNDATKQKTDQPKKLTSANSGLKHHTCPSRSDIIGTHRGRPTYIKLQEGVRLGCPKCNRYKNLIDQR